MGLELISPPAVEPVTLSELKEFLRVDSGDTSQDDVITTTAMAARAWVEARLKRKLVAQTWRQYLDFFPGYYAIVTGQPGSSPVLTGPALLAGIRYAIVLPHPPVNAIVNFQYINADGETTVMNPATDFLQDLASNPARLTPPFGQFWPVAMVVLNAVQIDFQVGYAMPVELSTASVSPPELNRVQAVSHIFQAADIGRPISIPGAGPNGGTLNTVIASVDSPPDTSATLRDSMATAVTNVTALLVNMLNGNPAFWEMVKNAIKFETKSLFAGDPKGLNHAAACRILSPARDLRL